MDEWIRILWTEHKNIYFVDKQGKFLPPILIQSQYRAVLLDNNQSNAGDRIMVALTDASHGGEITTEYITEIKEITKAQYLDIAERYSLQTTERERTRKDLSDEILTRKDEIKILSAQIENLPEVSLEKIVRDFL